MKVLGSIMAGARLLYSLCAAVVVLPGIAVADVVTMKNGDRLTGKVERMRGATLEFSTAYAGTVSLDANKVQTLVTDQDVTIVLKDHSRVIGRLGVSDGRLLVQPPEPGAPVADVDPRRVSTLEPGVMTDRDWLFTGRINLGLSDTTGNTELRRYNLDAETIARRGRSRWTTTARGNEATEREVETEMNAVVGLKYDRFVSEYWYGYGGTTFEHDRFKDLRLRSTLGLGAGQQLFQDARTNLALESGLDRVWTDYFDALDERFYAIRLASRFDHWLWQDVVQVFNNNQMFVSLADISTSFVRTQSGLRFPLKGGLLASLLFNLDWDGNPAPGRESVDRQLVLSLGYRW